jgi:hypothetical protein
MAEAAQQASRTLPTQEVEADAPFLAVDLYSMGCLLASCIGPCNMRRISSAAAGASAQLARTCTMCARSCEYLHESPRMHVPCGITMLKI